MTCCVTRMQERHQAPRGKGRLAEHRGAEIPHRAPALSRVAGSGSQQGCLSAEEAWIRTAGGKACRGREGRRRRKRVPLHFERQSYLGNVFTFLVWLWGERAHSNGNWRSPIYCFSSGLSGPMCLVVSFRFLSLSHPGPRLHPALRSSSLQDLGKLSSPWSVPGSANQRLK